MYPNLKSCFFLPHANRNKYWKGYNNSISTVLIYELWTPYTKSRRDDGWKRSAWRAPILLILWFLKQSFIKRKTEYNHFSIDSDMFFNIRFCWAVRLNLVFLEDKPTIIIWISLNLLVSYSIQNSHYLSF